MAVVVQDPLERDDATPLLAVARLVGIPARTYHALHRRNLDTVGQVAALSERELLALPNMGPRGVAGIKAALDAWYRLPVYTVLLPQAS